MDSVSAIIARVLRRHGLKQQTEASLVTRQANAWIADHLPDRQSDVHARALMEDGTLLLECTTSVAAQECQQHLPHLTLYLRDDCGHTSVRTIRLLRSRVPAASQGSGDSRHGK